MNRKIKFRGKSLATGEWVYGDLQTSHRESKCIIHRYNKDLDKYLHDEVNQATVGQFTGLCDKNGKEIYEGDIIEGQRYRHLIRCEEKEAAFMAVLLPEYSWVRNDCYISQEWVTEFGKQVIGNEFDNPDLIKSLERIK